MGVDYFDDTNEYSGFYMYMYLVVVLMARIILTTPMKTVVFICTCISDSEQLF